MVSVCDCCTKVCTALKKVATATPAGIDAGACQRLQHGSGADVGWSDQHPKQRGGEQRHDAGGSPEPAQAWQAGDSHLRGYSLHRHALIASSCLTCVATATRKSTTRGPQRDATSSSTPMTCPDLTAAIEPQPGRAATVLAL